jgi:hypothetical protein
VGQGSSWQHHLFYKREVIKTTWKFRLAMLLLVILVGFLTRGFWIPAIGRSLVCTEPVGPSEAIVVENFDPSYRLFKRAAALQRAGSSARILIPTQASPDDPEVVDTVSRGITELMIRLTQLQNPEIVPIPEIEPISLNAAYRIRDLLTEEHLRSVTILAPAFRSRRSSLVYRAALRPAGIRVSCMPVFGGHTPENWTHTWHGIQDVVEQFTKLQFYRFVVLPFPPAGRAERSRGRTGRAVQDDLRHPGGSPHHKLAW